MTTNVRAVFDRRKKATPTVAAKVEIEVFFSRTERKWISTDIELYSNQWEDGLVVRHALAKQLNRKIANLIADYRDLIRQMYQEGRDVDLYTFNRLIEVKAQKQTAGGFIDFAYSVLEKRKLRHSTIKAHHCTFEALPVRGLYARLMTLRHAI